MKKIKTIKDFSKKIKNEVVILRLDLNVPLNKDGQITDDTRIKATLPTIEYLIKKNAKIVILSHLGRIKTEDDKKFYSLKNISKRLEELLGTKVEFLSENVGENVEKVIKLLQPKDILMLENTRFQDVKKGEYVGLESKNNHQLGKYWANLGNYYVYDAFALGHRTNASTVGIITNSKNFAIGLLMEKEIKVLSSLFENPKRPFIVLIGGAKISDKIHYIESFVEIADKVIIGTALSYTFLKARGKKVGKSPVDNSKIEWAKNLMEKYSEKLLISTDSMCASEYKDIPGEVYFDIPDDKIGLDIGPESIDMITKELEEAKTIFWNGPFGVTEFMNFRQGSLEIAKSITSKKRNLSVVGGGDSIAMIRETGLENKITYISTGGGATLEFLSNKTLPILDIIEQYS